MSISYNADPQMLYTLASRGNALSYNITETDGNSRYLQLYMNSPQGNTMVFDPVRQNLSFTDQIIKGNNRTAVNYVGQVVNENPYNFYVGGNKISDVYPDDKLVGITNRNLIFYHDGPVNPGTANTPYYYAYCTEESSGQIKVKPYPFSPDYNDPWQNHLGEVNIPSCKWVNQDDILQCCTSNPNQPKGATCGPDYVSGLMNGGGCVIFMAEYCKLWDKEPDPIRQAKCFNYLQNFANNQDAGAVVQKTIIDNLAKKDFPDYDSARDYNDPFLTDTVPLICSYIPTACDPILNKYGAQFTRNDLDGDSTLQKLIGCHLSTGQPVPEIFGLTFKNNSVQPNQYSYDDSIISKQCDSVCVLPNTIQDSTGKCSQSVCLIDGININSINSDTGSINIDQDCSCPQPGTCKCFFSNSAINIINSKIKDGININQNCKSCVTFSGNDVNNTKEIDCKKLTSGQYNLSLIHI